MARRNNIPNLIFQIFFKRGDSSKETKIDKIDTGPYIISRMKIIRFPFIFKRGSRVIGRWSPLPNPLLRGADSFALISCHGFLPAHNACRTRCATPSRIHDATRPASFSPRQMREACPECVRERELSPRRNRSNRREREREGKNGKKEKGEKERYLIDEVRCTRKKKRRKASVRRNYAFELRHQS